MPIACSCPHCGHGLKVNEKFAGRKALCPQCEGVVAVPRAGAAAVAVAATGRGAAPAPPAAPAGTLLEEAKDLAALAVESAFLTRARADQCVAWYGRTVARKGAGAPSFGDAMLEQGALTEPQVRELVMSRNRRRQADVPAAAKAGVGTRECPNCFEIIQKKSRSCRYCGANLQEPELCDQCPNCGGTQPPGGKLCQSCGVDIQTGLYAGMQKRRCPKCGVLASGLESVCVVCGTSFDKPRALVKAEAVAGAAGSLVSRLMPLALLVLFFGGIFWVYKNWDSLTGQAKVRLYGQEEASLRARVEKFGQALVYKDYEGARALMASRNVEVDRALDRIAGLLDPKETVAAVALTKVLVEGSQATAYVDVTIKPPEKPKDKPKDAADLGPLLGGGPRERVVHLAWKWTLREGEWLYAGPL